MSVQSQTFQDAREYSSSEDAVARAYHHCSRSQGIDYWQMWSLQLRPTKLSNQNAKTVNNDHDASGYGMSVLSRSAPTQ